MATILSPISSIVKHWLADLFKCKRDFKLNWNVATFEKKSSNVYDNSIIRFSVNWTKLKTKEVDGMVEPFDIKFLV